MVEGWYNTPKGQQIAKITKTTVYTVGIAYAVALDIMITKGQVTKAVLSQYATGYITSSVLGSETPASDALESIDFFDALIEAAGGDNALIGTIISASADLGTDGMVRTVVDEKPVGDALIDITFSVAADKLKDLSGLDLKTGSIAKTIKATIGTKVYDVTSEEFKVKLKELVETGGSIKLNASIKVVAPAELAPPGAPVNDKKCIVTPKPKPTSPEKLNFEVPEKNLFREAVEKYENSTREE